ncbi:putative nuclease HARBI1 [Harmonia axyridis]|uniref:putative nuclease HARBI1 n=1 Tax=Harmonia axyridis TaxID=115357 RepID=UPI001E278C15|nr:putative nuclease HARBI1 [Harmonia axyridis]
MAFRRVYDLAFEDDDSDEEFVVRRPRWIREREDHFQNLDNADFEKRFRLSKKAALQILGSIEEQIEFANDKNNSVSPMNQLLCTLRYYATGCHQMTVADFTGISKSTAHRIIHRVSTAIASLRPLHITFPETQEEIRRTQTEFFGIASFPRVLGAIDCTHVKIKTPGGDNAELFRCRKGYFSLNVQAICNAKLEFTDIVARWPGSSHDSTIFRNCYRKAIFDDDRYGNAVLVGDSGYSCTKYFMTPFENCLNPAEQLYNESQIRTRNPVERMFGVWKRRFPVLSLGFRIDLDKVFPVIVATAVLHNVLRRRGEDVPPFDAEFEANLPAPWDVIIAQGDMGQNPIAVLGHPLNERRDYPEHRERRTMVHQYFTRLVMLERQRREIGRVVVEEHEEIAEDPHPEVRQDQ